VLRVKQVSRLKRGVSPPAGRKKEATAPRQHHAGAEPGYFSGASLNHTPPFFGVPGKAYEREAEWAADRVLEAGRRSAGAGLAGEIGQLPAHFGHSPGGRVIAQVFHSRRGGSPLSDVTRRFMEPRFGCDFGRVRVHTDSFAAKVCSSLGAQALTAGNNIFFGAGRYHPGSYSGRRMLAHELSHVVQQSHVPALQAYGRNVHYERTKFWAESVFGPFSREAETIAREDNGVDSGWTHPHFATPTEFLYSSDDDFLHFPARTTARAAVDAAINKADPADFGKALHRYQDSFSHSFPPGAPLSDLARGRGRGEVTGIGRDILLRLHRVYPNTYFGRGAAIWHALLGYYPDDYLLNGEQSARDTAMERDSRHLIGLFHSVWRTVRMMRVPVPPGLTVPGMLFGPQHVAPYMRRN